MNRQGILLVILGISILAGAYVWYTTFSAPSAELAVEQGPDTGISPQFLEIAFLLDKTNIDSAFFDSPKFKELQAGVKLPPLPDLRGRANPFSN